MTIQAHASEDRVEMRRIGSQRVPELDGLRALSILLVVTVHMHTHRWDGVAGTLGVEMFFVISGYLITGLALREEQAAGVLNFRGFYLRRAFRLFPLYYLVLGVYCVLIFVVGIGPEKRPAMLAALPYYLFYLQEIPHLKIQAAGAIVPFYQSWTLGIEEKFYLLWPVLCFGLLRGARRLRLPIAATLLIVCVAGGKWTISYAYILFGCVPALTLESSGFRRAAQRASRWMLYPAALMTALFPFFTRGLSQAQARLLFSALCSWLLLNLSSSTRVTAVHRILRWRPLTYVGTVSYGIYLIHILVIPVGERLAGERPEIAYLLTILLSTLVAAALYRWIEQPLIKAGSAMSRRRRLEAEISV